MTDVWLHPEMHSVCTSKVAVCKGRISMLVEKLAQARSSDKLEHAAPAPDPAPAPIPSASASGAEPPSQQPLSHLPPSASVRPEQTAPADAGNCVRRTSDGGPYQTEAAVARKHPPHMVQFQTAVSSPSGIAAAAKPGDARGQAEARQFHWNHHSSPAAADRSASGGDVGEASKIHTTVTTTLPESTPSLHLSIHALNTLYAFLCLSFFRVPLFLRAGSRKKASNNTQQHHVTHRKAMLEHINGLESQKADGGSLTLEDHQQHQRNKARLNAIRRMVAEIEP